MCSAITKESVSWFTSDGALCFSVLLLTSCAPQIVLHGACLGLGLSSMATGFANPMLLDLLKVVLLHFKWWSYN